jgi:hypothetical protein
MTKLITLVTTLVLGTSSLALARPAQFRANDGWRERQELRIDRDQASGQRTYRPTWVALSGATRLERGRDVIPVGVQQGRFTQLRFQATEGVSAIDRVLIRFGDGHWQVADLGKRLDAGAPIVEVQLDGLRRNIDQIIVIGSSGWRGSYQVFGI